MSGQTDLNLITVLRQRTNVLSAFRQVFVFCELSVLMVKPFNYKHGDRFNLLPLPLFSLLLFDTNAQFHVPANSLPKRVPLT